MPHLQLRIPLLVGLFALALGSAAPPRQWTLHPGPARFEHLDTSHGLSQGSVFAIQQDRRGFLWFGTEDGLNRWDGYRFKVFRQEPENPHSLGGSTINTLFQDSQGELWIGTEGGGLNRLDIAGERFVRYPDFPSASAACLAEDTAGNLWIGCAGQGLVLLPQASRPPAKPSFRAFPGHPPSGLGDHSVTAILQDRAGTLWMALEEGGLHRIEAGEYDSYQFPRHQAQGPRPEGVLSLVEDEHGTLWMGSPEGLYSLSPDRSRFERFVPRPGDRESLGFPYVHRLFKDKEGLLWLGLDGGGLDRMRRRSDAGTPPRFDHFTWDPRRPESLSASAVESIYEDHFGVLWVGTYNAGLNRLILNPGHPDHREIPPVLQFRHGEEDPRSLSGDTVSSILQDRRGTLWVGTDGQGLNRSLPPVPGRPLEFQRFRKSRIPGELGDDVITLCFEDSKGRLWLGTYTGGLVRVEAPESPRPRFRHFRHDPARRDSLPSDFVVSMLEDRKGRLWVGTVDGGLSRLDPERGTFTNLLSVEAGGPLINPSIFALAEDAFGTLWMGSVAGLMRLDPESGSIRTYQAGPEPDRLSHNYIRTLAVDRRGQLWIGTQEGGLNRMEIPPWQGPDPKFSTIGPESGLPGRMIIGLQLDAQDQLWVSTPNRICRFDPERKQAYLLRDEGQEFQRNAYHCNASGELFFGSRKGLTLFHPGDLRQDPLAPSVLLLDFQLFNRSLEVGEAVNGRVPIPVSLAQTTSIQLTHRDSVFSLEFAGLHTVAPEAIRYAYKLDGLDPDWVQAGSRRFATYTTLAPGNYVFRVKASNPDGVWSPRETTLQIRILPPLWRRLWFQAMALLGLAGGSWYLLHRRLVIHKENENHLKRLVEERTTQLEAANAELTRLATRDAMTGLYNYRHFESSLQRIWSQAMRDRGTLSLILIDIDYFKRYNDSLGHIAGNACLRWVALAVESAVHRDSDLVARYGGEEFVVIATGTDLPGVAQFAERIRLAVQALALPHPDSPAEPIVTISLGCASATPSPGQSWQDLITQADEALYRAKAKGRNKVCATRG